MTPFPLPSPLNRRPPGLLPLLLLTWGGLQPMASAGAAPAAAPPQHLPIQAYWCPASSAPAPGGASATPPWPAARGSSVVGSARVPAGCVALEVPRTLRQYSFGLQLRDPLGSDRGMWFPYRPARRARFWMHRTPHPLDLVFVRDGRVVAIEAAAPPCMHLPCPSYGPDEPVDGVLEVAAGEAVRRGLAAGDPLRVVLLIPVGPEAPAPD